MHKITVPPHVFHACQMLKEHGHRAYVVGGCVRDQLLGRTPKDWDVTTSARPDEVKQCFSTVIDTGIEFGTVTVVYPSKETIEVTTFRGDGKYSDGRRPDEVNYVESVELDLMRRDFTINAMAFDPLVGELVDPYGGQDDLRKGIIRAVGNAHERMNEDSLRMLRALRFKAQLGFTLDKDLFDVMGAYGARAQTCAIERRAQELLKALSGSYFHELHDTWKDLPELWEAWGFFEDLRSANPQPRFVDINKVVNDPKLRLSHFLSTWRSSDVSQFCRNMKLSGDFISKVPEYVVHIQSGAKNSFQWNAERRLYLSKAIDRGLDLEDLFHLLEARGLKGTTRGLRDVLAEKPPLTLSDLAINGNHLKNIGMAGREIGWALNHLLERVIDEPSHNTPEKLIALANRALGR